MTWEGPHGPATIRGRVGIGRIGAALGDSACMKSNAGASERKKSSEGALAHTLLFFFALARTLLFFLAIALEFCSSSRLLGIASV
jgi:F0F1-type ATP synthase membrane subunit c/vacuolar-type H+-ATPase subunit K